MKALLDNWIMLLPLIALQLGLAIYCIRKIVRDGVKNLSKPLWIVLVLFLNLVGPILFILTGQREA